VNNIANGSIKNQHRMNQTPAWRVKKTDASTGHINDFFPPSWSKQKIIEEIAFARSRLTMQDYISETKEWTKFASDGQVKIHMYIGETLPTSPPVTSVPPLNILYGSSWAK